MQDRRPEFAVEVVPLSPAGAVAAVTTGEVDGSLSLDPATSRSITRVPCWREGFVVAMADRSSLPRQAHVSVATILTAGELLVAGAWATPAERWLHGLACGTRVAIPPVRPLASYQALVTSIGLNAGVGLVPSGLAGGLVWAGVDAHAVEGRSPRLAVVLLHRTDNRHPGIDILRTVIAIRPWRKSATASAAVPAETPGRSP